MSKRTEKPTVARHLKLYEEDWLFLCEHYGPDSPTKYGPGAVVRELLHARIKAIKATMTRAVEHSQVEDQAQVSEQLIAKMEAQARGQQP
jgi:hypothetical protein